MGRREQKFLFTGTIATFLSKILAPEEVCPGTGKLTKRNGDESKRRIQAQAGQKYHAIPK